MRKRLLSLTLVIVAWVLSVGPAYSQESQERIRQLTAKCGIEPNVKVCVELMKFPEMIKRRTAKCEKGDVEACTRLGHMYYNRWDWGLEKESDRPKARVFFKKACDLGDMLACHQLAGMHAGGRGGRQDHPMAHRLHEKACSGGIAESCADKAWLHAYASERKDLGSARKYYEKACAMGHEASCFQAGKFMYDGKGGSKDLATAKKLFKKACDYGYSGGCVGLAASYLSGWGGNIDKRRAAKLLKKACDDKNPEGCHILGNMYETGNGVPRDLKQAEYYFIRVCDLGGIELCKYPSKLNLDALPF